MSSATELPKKIYVVKKYNESQSDKYGFKDCPDGVVLYSFTDHDKAVEICEKVCVKAIKKYKKQCMRNIGSHCLDINKKKAYWELTNVLMNITFHRDGIYIPKSSYSNHDVTVRLSDELLDESDMSGDDVDTYLKSKFYDLSKEIAKY